MRSECLLLHDCISYWCWSSSMVIDVRPTPCLGLVVQESRSCSAIVNNDHQFMSSSSAVSEGQSVSSCGSRSQPWRLEAPLGQRINISLLDFSGLAATSRDGDVTCYQYGYVIDKVNKKNVSICSVKGVEKQRESHVCTSESNTVNIVLTGIDMANSNFLVKVQGMLSMKFEIANETIFIANSTLK